MKRSHLFPSLIISAAVSVSPLRVHAETAPDPVQFPSVIITEVQTGASAAGDEFVELYNRGDGPADLTGWQLRYANATAGNTTVVAAIGSVDSPVVLPSHGYFVVRTANVPLDVTITSQIYAAKLSAADKAVGLFAPDTTICKLIVIDAVAWGASTYGEGAAVPAVGSGERLLRRYQEADGKYADTNNNARDFTADAGTAGTLPQLAPGATPGSDNMAAAPADQLPQPGSASLMPASDISGCVVPAPPVPDETDETVPEDEPPILLPPDEEPPAVIVAPEDKSVPADEPVVAPVRRNDGLKAPQITEMLPNPAAPQTDAADELIELYNSNDVPFYLEGFVLESGITTKRKYTFPAGTVLEPRSFASFFSADTRLSLSNAGSQARLLDPAGNVIAQAEPYGTAKDGQAWALAGGTWYWTVTPTPGGANTIKEPVTKKQVQTANAAKKKQTVAVPSVKGTGTTGASVKPATAQSVAAVPVSDSLTDSVPFHTGVLAVAALFALLYGAYEYRRDIANKIYQFRTDRAARRTDRSAAERRRSH